MTKINPYFELNGTRYEIKKTRWLIAEYNKMRNETPLSDDDKVNVLKAQQLISDVKKYNDKETEWWDKFCENPTEENQRTYFLFKNMSDKAVRDYNEFAATSKPIEKAHKHTIDLLEKIAIKGLGEQYFDMDEAKGRHLWESYVDTVEHHAEIGEWLMAMNDCLFGENNEDNDEGFLAQKRKMDAEREQNRKSAILKRR